MLGKQKRLLAVQHRRVDAGGIVVAVDLPAAQVQPHTAQQCRMRVGVEIGIDQVGELAGAAMDLDHVGAFDLAEVGPAAALVDAQQGAERGKGAGVDVEVIRQELAGGGVPAGVVDRGGIAGRKEQGVGGGAGAGVGAEEGFHVALEGGRQLRQGGAATEAGEGEVDEQVFAAALGDGVPGFGSGDSLDNGEGPLQRAEALDDGRRTGELGRVGQPAEKGDALHQRFEGRSSFFEAQLGDAPAGEDLAAAEAVGEELLAPVLVLEEIEGADAGGDRLGLELGFEVGLQLVLVVELLERAAHGEDAVVEFNGNLTTTLLAIPYWHGYIAPNRQIAGTIMPQNSGEQERATDKNASTADPLADDQPQTASLVPQPHPIQVEALNALQVTRAAGNSAGMVVLASGLGKTWLSAFDTNRPEYQRVLFVAHREEILTQARETYRRIRPDARIGLYAGFEKVPDADIVFASIQTLGRRQHLEIFAPDRFDYIVVDEFHHAAATTYRRLLDYFTPKFLLALTATPERTDGRDLLALCQENLVYRCNVPEGIRRGRLCPFHYFGVPDEVDYRNIPWRSSRFDEEALTAAVATEARARNVLEQYRKRAGKRTLAFCCSQRHADFMANFFREHGLRAVAVHSGLGVLPRDTSLAELDAGNLDIVCAVDMFNEGVDLPLVDTVMMLRPTESSIVWLQQFGRGLRTAPGKSHLTVIDYIGNHKSFLAKPALVVGSGQGLDEIARVIDQISADQVTLPPGCEVTYELVTVDILRSLLPAHVTERARYEAYYEDFKDRHGRRPLAFEAFHDGCNLRTIRQISDSWLDFVNSRGDLTAGQQWLVREHRDFLGTLEMTPMTRSFKMLTLEAMIVRDALPGVIGILELTAEFCRLADRSARLKADVGVPLDDAAQMRKYLEKNPIAAWVGGKGTGGNAHFAYEADVFRSTFDVPGELREEFKELVREILDWRLADYLQRGN